MALIFFKINKHKSFNYKPVFYDPDKEGMATYKAKEKAEGEYDIDNFKSKLHSRWHAPKKNKVFKFSVTKIALIITFLFAVLYFILK